MGSGTVISPSFFCLQQRYCSFVYLLLPFDKATAHFAAFDLGSCEMQMGGGVTETGMERGKMAEVQTGTGKHPAGGQRQMAAGMTPKQRYAGGTLLLPCVHLTSYLADCACPTLGAGKLCLHSVSRREIP